MIVDPKRTKIPKTGVCCRHHQIFSAVSAHPRLYYGNRIYTCIIIPACAGVAPAWHKRERASRTSCGQVNLREFSRDIRRLLNANDKTPARSRLLERDNAATSGYLRERCILLFRWRKDFSFFFLLSFFFPSPFLSLSVAAERTGTLLYSLVVSGVFSSAFYFLRAIFPRFLLVAARRNAVQSTVVAAAAG